MFFLLLQENTFSSLAPWKAWARRRFSCRESSGQTGRGSRERTSSGPCWITGEEKKETNVGQGSEARGPVCTFSGRGGEGVVKITLVRNAPGTPATQGHTNLRSSVYSHTVSAAGAIAVDRSPHPGPQPSHPCMRVQTPESPWQGRGQEKRLLQSRHLLWSRAGIDCSPPETRRAQYSPAVICWGSSPGWPPDLPGPPSLHLSLAPSAPETPNTCSRVRLGAV